MFNNYFVLKTLQARVSELYDVPHHAVIEEHLLSSAEKSSLPGALAHTPEQMFVQQNSEGLSVGLYIAPNILMHLSQDDPFQCLHEGNINSFCVAIEGVSHFVLLYARFQNQEPLKQLEMEIQAEVDKFICSWQLLIEQGVEQRQASYVLLDQLFNKCYFYKELSDKERSIYQCANDVARRYCKKLTDLKLFPTERVFIKTVQSFFYMGLAEKIYITR